MRQIILGSTSSFRSNVLREHNIPHAFASADIDEKLVGDRDGDPATLTLAVARAKAEAIMQKPIAAGLLITADQILVWNDRIFEKPRDASEARDWLRAFHEHPLRFITAVIVTDTSTRRAESGVDETRITMRKLTDQAIDEAIARGTILSCCGAFDLDDPSLAPFVTIVAGDPTSAVGMPIPLLKKLLFAHSKLV